jgi:hypothetical protein
MVSITRFGVIMETTCDFVFASNYIEAVDRCWIMRMREDATMHHPKSLAFSSVYYINVSTTIPITSPHTINPARLIKSFHPRLINLLTRAAEVIFQ